MNNLEQIYIEHLSTPFKDFDGVERLPIGNRLLKSMIAKNHMDNEKFLEIKEELVNAIKNQQAYFWSDTHFFHKNIIKYTGRPFDETGDMNYKMRGEWEKLNFNDWLIHGGDVSFGDVNLSIEYLSNLPGKKLLVYGNHDFFKNEKGFRDTKAFDYGTMCFDFELDGIQYWVTHYPIRDSLLPEKVINIHGHVHEKKISDKHRNISVEMTNYKPIKLEQMLELNQVSPYVRAHKEIKNNLGL